MAKYYAVKRGHNVGVFENWDECKVATSGFSNADYKAFSTKEEAEAYINGVDIWKERIQEDIQAGYLVSFCDGSYSESLKKYSYGVLIIESDMTEVELCGSAANPQYVASRNVSGEILGVINTLDWAVSNGFDKVKIYHDLEGLSKWITGEWQATTAVVQAFQSIYKSKYEGILDIVFEKVKGHSNNPYNEKADHIAASALESGKRIAIKGDHWFTLPSVRDEDLNAILDLVKSDYPNAQVTMENDTAIKACYRIVLDGKRITVSHYKSAASKVVIQGEPSGIFQIFIAYIVELLGIDADAILSSAYRKTIDRKAIDADVNMVLPYYPANYPNNIRRLLRQAVINLRYYVEAEEYSQYAFPALRALEGHLKYLIAEASSVPCSGFNQFNKDGTSGRYIYVRPGIASDKKARIEECYNYYKAVRDSTFHFGDIIGAIDTTRVIGTKKEADEIIQHCIEMINRTLV